MKMTILSGEKDPDVDTAMTVPMAKGMTIGKMEEREVERIVMEKMEEGLVANVVVVVTIADVTIERTAIGSVTVKKEEDGGGRMEMDDAMMADAMKTAREMTDGLMRGIMTDTKSGRGLMVKRQSRRKDQAGNLKCFI